MPSPSGSTQRHLGRRTRTFPHRRRGIAGHGPGHQSSAWLPHYPPRSWEVLPVVRGRPPSPHHRAPDRRRPTAALHRRRPDLPTPLTLWGRPRLSAARHSTQPGDPILSIPRAPTFADMRVAVSTGCPTRSRNGCLRNLALHRHRPSGRRIAGQVATGSSRRPPAEMQGLGLASVALSPMACRSRSTISYPGVSSPISKLYRVGTPVQFAQSRFGDSGERIYTGDSRV